MTTPKGTPTRIERTGHLRWVTVGEVHTNPRAQRELRPGWAATIAADFDPDRFTPPLLSLRHGKFYVVDGQHRFEAMRLMGWEEQQVQCWVYEGISEAEEADLFLWHNNRKSISSFDSFRIGVTAERAEEVDIDRIVRAVGLKVAVGADGGIGATTALRKVYANGPATLTRTLKIVHNSYGDDGLRGEVIEGIGRLCARWNGELDDGAAIAKLSTARGGLGALNTRAAVARKALGKPIAECYAAAATDIINSGKGGKKLPGWWKG